VGTAQLRTEGTSPRTELGTVTLMGALMLDRYALFVQGCRAVVFTVLTLPTTVVYSGSQSLNRPLIQKASPMACPPSPWSAREV